MCLFSELRGAVEEVLPTLKEQGISVLLLSEKSGGDDITSLSSNEIGQESEQPLPRELRANVTVRSIALYIYTSGTTGN